MDRPVRRVDEAEDRVAHDQRRLGRVEDDDRLAALGAADVLDRAGRGLGELVDVGARARAGRLRGDRGDDLGVRRRATTRETAATIGIVAWPPQVTMLTFGGVEVLVEVDRRARRTGRSRPGSGRSCACRAGAAAAALATCAFAEVASKTISISSKSGSAIRPSTPSCGGRHAEARGAGEAVGVGVDADHRAHLEVLGGAHHLDHQVGADVARPDDGDLGSLLIAGPPVAAETWR